RIGLRVGPLLRALSQPDEVGHGLRRVLLEQLDREVAFARHEVGERLARRLLRVLSRERDRRHGEATQRNQHTFHGSLLKVRLKPDTTYTYSVPSPASTDSPPTRTRVISPFSSSTEMCTWLGRPIFAPWRLNIAPARSGG